MANNKHMTHCKYGHELTPENTYQTFKNGVKNGRKCKECAKRLSSKHRVRYPQKAYRGRIESQMRLRYGIASLQERDQILESQGNACAICGCEDCEWGKGFNKKWHVDHEHGTQGTFRGILCSRCNLALGLLEDDPELLTKMSAYLKQRGK